MSFSQRKVKGTYRHWGHDSYGGAAGRRHPSHMLLVFFMKKEDTIILRSSDALAFSGFEKWWVFGGFECV